MTVVAVDRAHQVADLIRFDDRRDVPRQHRLQCAAQIRSGAALTTSGRNAVSKHLPAGFQQRVRQFARATCLDAPQRLQQHRCADLGERKLAQPGEDVLLEALHPALCVVIAPADLLCRVELARGHLEAGVGVEPGTEALHLPREHRICARLMLLARIITCDPGLLQTQIWIAPEGKALLLPVEAVLPEPALGPRGRDLQVQTAGIGQAHAGPTRVATRVLALLVGEHGGTKHQMAANTPFVPPDVPPTSLRCRGTAGAFLTQATV